MRRIAEEILSRRGWLARQPEPFRRLVFNECLLQQCDRGAPIYHLADPPGGIYGIAAGALAVSIAPGDGGPHFAHLGTAGTWFGEGSFLTGEPRRVGLEAATECILFESPASGDGAYGGKGSHGHSLFCSDRDEQSRSCPGSRRRSHDPKAGAAHRRSAGALSRAQDERRVRISQAELGTLANASRKLVNKALQRFAASAWVAPHYGAIQILDMQALKHFAAGRRL